MSAATVNVTLSESDVFKNIIYVLMGSSIALCNLLIFLCALVQKPFHHKEYVVIGGLALADSLNGFATLFAAISRVALLTSGQAHLVTKLECMFTSYNFIWHFSDMLAALMLLVVSVDRLCCVAVPMKYYNWDLTYALCLVGGTYAYVFASGLIGIALSFLAKQLPNLHPLCYFPVIHVKTYNVYHNNLKLSAAFLSCILYVPVLALFKKHQLKVSQSMNTRQQKNQASAQRKLTISLGISCCFTFFLYMLPNSVIMLLRTLHTTEEYNTYFGGLSLYFYILSLFNPLANLWIYVSRHKTIRVGVIRTLTCRGISHSEMTAITTKGAGTSGRGETQTAVKEQEL